MFSRSICKINKSQKLATIYEDDLFTDIFGSASDLGDIEMYETYGNIQDTGPYEMP